MFKKQKNGFSFVQILLILVAIAVVCGIVIYVVNPTKILQKSRDSIRFSDMNTLAGALNQYLADNHDFKGLVGPYSTIDANFSGDAARKNIDGTGWIPLNFSLISTGAPFSVLPIDPLNNSKNNYRFGVSVQSKTYEIDCVFERPENIQKHSTDGGNDPNVYELGTDLTIL